MGWGTLILVSIGIALYQWWVDHRFRHVKGRLEVLERLAGVEPPDPKEDPLGD